MSDSDDFEFDPEEAELEANLSSKIPLVRAKALRDKAIELLHRNHNDNVAPIYLEESFNLLEAQDAIAELGATAYWFGWVLGHGKEFDRALEVHHKGAQYSRQVMDDENELNNLHSIASIYKRKKDRDKTAKYFGLAYELAKASNSHSLPWIRNLYIRSLRKVSNYGLAAELARAAIQEGRESEEDFPIVMGDQELAAILMEQGDFEGALAAATEAYNIAVFVKQDREAERAQFNKAKALNLAGRYSSALEELTQIQVLKRYKSRNKHRLRVDLEVAKAKAGMGETAAAAELFKTVIPLLDSFNVRGTAAEAMYAQAMNYMVMGNDLDAEMVLGSLIERLSSEESSVLSRSASVLLGGIFEAREQWERVVSVYEPLDSDPTNRYSVWFPAVLQSLATAYLKLGRLADAEAAAVTVIKTGLAVDPSLNLGGSLAVRAAVASAAGDSVRARRFGREAIKAYLAGGFAVEAAALAALYL